MNGHPQFDEDFDLFVLGAMEGEERQALEAHLADCPVCERRAQDARGRLALMALAAQAETPPMRAREGLMDRVRGASPKIRRAPVGRWLTPALVAVALVLVVFTSLVNIENRDLKRRLTQLESANDLLQKKAAQDRAVVDLLRAPDTLKVTLVSETARPVPAGKAFYHPQKGLIFYASNLPTLSSNRTYQLWLVPTKGNPISAGTFEVDAHGNGQVLLPSLPSGVAAAAFAVTVEPTGGVPQPTGAKVLIGAVS